jgi:hypothetical protein
MRSVRRPTRKQIEEALKKSEEKFSKAFRQSPLALRLTSAKNYRYEVNETLSPTQPSLSKMKTELSK